MGLFSDLFEGAAPVAGRLALLDLDVKTRQAVSAHLAARRALARAMAAANHEAARRCALAARAADLEERAVLALRAGHDDMAVAAAEAIASLDCELGASARAITEQDAAVAQLRRAVEDQRRRLADLDRGRRLAAVQAALNESRGVLSPIGRHLALAEQALDAVVQRQAEAEIFATADDQDATRLIEDLADAGFGAPLRSAARDVLARLRAAAAESSPSPNMAIIDASAKKAG